MSSNVKADGLAIVLLAQWLLGLSNLGQATKENLQNVPNRGELIPTTALQRGVCEGFTEHSG